MKKNIFKIAGLILVVAMLGLAGCGSPVQPAVTPDVIETNPITGPLEVVAPFGVDLDNLMLTVQQAVNLEALGGGEVIWESSDPSIASVNQNGRVVALSVNLGDVRYNWAMNNPSAHFLIGNIVETKVTSSAPGWATYNATNHSLDATVTITATRIEDGEIVEIELTTTTAVNGNMNDDNIPALKDQFAPYFMMGNLNSPGLTSVALNKHFDMVTYENNMKPSYVGASLGTTTGVLTLNETGSNNMVTMTTNVQNVINAGFLLHGHVPYWHSQNASWASYNNLNAVYNAFGTEGVVSVMDQYAVQYAGRTGIKGNVYSWDVLNEVIYDDNQWDTPANAAAATWQQSVRQGAVATSWFGVNGGATPAGLNATNEPNTWVRVIGPEDAIYYMFVSWRKADPEALLVLNDFNTEFPTKAKKYIDMITYLNERYAASDEKAAMVLLGEDPDRPLVEIVGFQEHHNLSHHLDQIIDQFDIFRPLGIKIHVTELDVVGMTSAIFNGASPANSYSYANVVRQADYYYWIFMAYLINHDLLDRVTWWGLNGSWRSNGQPLPWTLTANPALKPAWWGIQRALEDYEALYGRGGLPQRDPVTGELLNPPPGWDDARTAPYLGEHSFPR